MSDNDLISIYIKLRIKLSSMPSDGNKPNEELLLLELVLKELVIKGYNPENVYQSFLKTGGIDTASYKQDSVKGKEQPINSIVNMFIPTIESDQGFKLKDEKMVKDENGVSNIKNNTILENKYGIVLNDGNTGIKVKCSVCNSRDTIMFSCSVQTCHKPLCRVCVKTLGKDYFCPVCWEKAIENIDTWKEVDKRNVIQP